jgi:hypothetical protein
MEKNRYEELVKYAQRIHGFSRLVSSERRYKLALSVLCSVANIDRHTAYDFITEYYSRMDIKMMSPKVLFNDLKINRG